MSQEPFRGSDAVALGHVTVARLRGPSFRRLFPDVYVDASAPLTAEVRARAAAVWAEPAGGVLAGWSAAELLGASCGPWDHPAEVLASTHLRRHPGAVLRRGDTCGAGFCAGVRVTSPLRTAWDLARRLDLVEAVVAVDALAAAGRRRPTFVPAGVADPEAARAWSRRRTRSPGFDPARLLQVRRDRSGARGARRLDRVVALADPRAESPPETRMRLLLVLAGLPRPQVQYTVRDRRGEMRFDLAYPEVLLAIEYDGDEHDDTLDRARDLRTAALGWHTLRLLYGDVVRAPQRTVAVVHSLYASRARSGERDTTAAGT